MEEPLELHNSRIGEPIHKREYYLVDQRRLLVHIEYAADLTPVAGHMTPAPNEERIKSSPFQ